MSSDIIPVLENGLNAYLVTPKQVTDVIKSAETPEEAANALRQAVKAFSLKRAVVVSDPGLEPRRTSVEALQKAGFTEIVSIDTLSIKVSSCIFNLSLNCAIGEPVFVYLKKDNSIENMPDVVVIQKCENGWQIIGTKRHFDSFRDEHPSARHSIMSNGSRELQTQHSGMKVHEAIAADPNFKEKFIRNRVNKGSFNGYDVLPYCGVDLKLAFGNKSDIIKLTDRVVPFSVSKEVDVGDADDVKAVVHVDNEEDDGPGPLVKKFNFKNKAHRIVSITVNVDGSLVPEVTLKTASTYEPPKKTTPVIYVVKDAYDTYLLEAVFRDRVSNEGSFETSEKLLSHMVETYSTDSTVGVYYVVSGLKFRSCLREFRTACEKAGYLNLKFITVESLYLSLLLDRAQIYINTSVKIAVVSSDTCRVIGRDVKHLRILEREEYPNFDIKTTEATTVLIDNSNNMYTKTDLDYFRTKFSKYSILVVAEKEHPKQLAKYFWSLANKTTFAGNIFNDFGDFEFAIEEHGAIMERIETRFARIPYVVTASYQVTFTKQLHIHIQAGDATMEELEEYEVWPGMIVEFTITVNSACDVTVDMLPFMPGYYQRRAPEIEELPMLDDDSKSSSVEVKSNVEVKKAEEVDDKKKKKRKKKKHAKTETTEPENLPTTLESGMSQLKLDLSPSVVLTFTSDNRVIIKADDTYTGDKEVLAYVRLQNGKPPQSGKLPFIALKKHPSSVFYDITRLLATDFDPDHPDPAWGFKTSRDANGKVIVCTRTDNITTFPIVLFGIVVRSVLLYIREHTKSDITSLGIKLPAGSTINNTELGEVAKRIGVELALLTE
uniref:Tudor domain-containing protein n=1 Tax=Panagrellus redivivus TaxID=6233 RepID=A0A7E4W1L3_PANRE